MPEQTQPDNAGETLQGLILGAAEIRNTSSTRCLLLVVKLAAKEQAIRLRVDYRLSLDEIAIQVKASRGALSLWLRDYPLTPEEMKARRRKNVPKSTRKPRSEKSALHQTVQSWGTTLSTDTKGRIAESAVALRLVVRGFSVFRSMFEGDTCDLVVRCPSGCLAKLQVKWVKRKVQGLPMVNVTRSNGLPYRQGDIDFLVGYDLYSDAAYVFSWSEFEGLGATITVRSSALEQWVKLKVFGM